MSRRYLERMSVRIAAGANSLVGLWKAKNTLIGSRAFNAELDLQLATMVCYFWPCTGLTTNKLSESIGYYW
jgi:hypothetical protein